MKISEQRIEMCRQNLARLAEAAPDVYARFESAIADALATAPAVVTPATLTAEEAVMASAFAGGEAEFSRLKGIAFGKLARLQRADRERISAQCGAANWSAQAAQAEREGLVTR